MEYFKNRKNILGLGLTVAGAAALGMGVYTTVNALTLNHDTEETKANESDAMNAVVNKVYGDTESSAKSMGMGAGLLAGGAAAAGLLLLTTGGLLLSPVGIKMQKMKFAKIGAIAALATAGLSPILGATSIGLYHTDTVQQAKQFIDFSKEFESEFMNNINDVETRARDMLDKAGWIEFADLLEKFKSDANVLKISDSNDPNYYKHNFLLAANMYVLGGKDILDQFGGIGANAGELKTENYFKNFDWGTSGYGQKLNELINIRNSFLPTSEKLPNGNVATFAKLDALEGAAVTYAAKKSAEWFKNFMHSYHSDFGTKATDEVIALTLSKLAYVSGNKNISYTTGDGPNLVPNSSVSPVEKFVIPSTLKHFSEISGMKDDGNGHFVLADNLKETIGIDELLTKYKPSWESDPLQYIHSNNAAGRTTLDLNAVTNSTNDVINKSWLSSFFENGHAIYMDESSKITDFTKLDSSIVASLPMVILGLSSPTDIQTIFSKTLVGVHTFITNNNSELVQSKSSYFLQMKLTLAKNYVQQVMMNISDTLTNNPESIYE